MQNLCQKCGKQNDNGAQFCTNCGASLFGNLQSTEANETSEITPAEKATVIANKTKEKTEQTTKAAKKIWEKFSFEERMIAAGSFIGLISFVLPWMNMVINSKIVPVYGIGVAGDFVSYLFLFPISMIAILALLIFSKKDTDIIKIKKARFYIFFGSVWFAVSFSIANAIIKRMFQEPDMLFVNFSVTYNFGWWLFLGSMILLTAGGFKLQGKLLDKIKE